MITRLARTSTPLLLILQGVLFSAGCSSDSTTGPTPPVTTTALRVSGDTALTSLGQTSQLTATAVLSNNNTQVVTGLTAWSARDLGVATVSSAGVLTSVAFGTTVIDATYQGQAGTADVRIAPGNTFILTGMITDATTLVPIDDALIEITGGGAVGPRSATSSAGQYSIVGLSGEITAAVTKPGYVTTERALTMSEDQDADFALRPAPSSQAARAN